MTGMSRRHEIRMTDAEVAAFLDEQRTVVAATVGRDGRPHLAPLWYVRDGAAVLSWTYARSQKVANLRRDPRATLLVEAGESYELLRGVDLECDVELVTDTAEVAGIGARVLARSTGTGVDSMPGFVRAQAPKRVGLVFRPTRAISWDHRKLGGGY